MPEIAPMAAPFDDEALLRYSRQIMLPGFDLAGQEKLRAARVLVVGAGGLGSPVCLYLAAAGIGHLLVVDHDAVELSNLQRQIAHRTADLGQPKAISAAAACQAINPLIQLEPIVARADADLLAALLPRVDCVVDCCDNFATRAAVNRACQYARVPLVSAAAIRLEGQLAVFDFRVSAAPCYACLYGDGLADAADVGCVANGVMAPLVGVLGSLQALTTIRLLTGLGDSGHGKLVVFDGLHNVWRTFGVVADPSCPVCATAPPG